MGNLSSTGCASVAQRAHYGRRPALSEHAGGPRPVGPGCVSRCSCGGLCDAEQFARQLDHPGPAHVDRLRGAGAAAGHAAGRRAPSLGIAARSAGPPGPASPLARDNCAALGGPALRLRKKLQSLPGRGPGGRIGRAGRGLIAHGLYGLRRGDQAGTAAAPAGDGSIAYSIGRRRVRHSGGFEPCGL